MCELLKALLKALCGKNILKKDVGNRKTIEDIIEKASKTFSSLARVRNIDIDFCRANKRNFSKSRYSSYGVSLIPSPVFSSMTDPAMIPDALRYGNEDLRINSVIKTQIKVLKKK